MSAKSQKLAAELADELAKRLPTLTLVQGSDVNGDATIALSLHTPQVAGEANAFIRVKAIDWPLSRNIIGQVSEVYTPTVIQLATEANYAGTTDNVADTLSAALLLPLLGTILTRGTQVEWYQSTTGTAPVVGTITGTPVATWSASLYWGVKAAQ